ncbi:16S rRNA pseudouridine(516) synthase RsuA [Marinimicrobium alkaliphilum]|uniref:16S rRNA pseudouridine(516) synthase RsuA n=1 Tax=Marinimicrobium alkaliphilum TaxID=2202654 RepID=UPI000DBA0C7C|nr:16S rRNA pseudouridine(516) synthase RsuA [Marinimicrobium alkaliphilum]
MRLDKFIAHTSGLSRTLTQRALWRGEVTVNGEVVKKAARAIQLSDTICLDGQVMQWPVDRYLMLHKPAGYLCARTDGQHPTVLDLIDLPRASALQIVGRLDLDTTGLLLLTDDGQWNHRLTSPRHACPKTYRVSTRDAIATDTATRFAEGIELRGERHPTRPAQLEQLSERECLLTIDEGKYHQVKRMFAALGNHVIALHRERIGALALDPDLTPGSFRALTQDEIERLG